MFNDILRVIELLLASIKGSKAPEARRRALAGNLLKIQRDLVAIVERGRGLLSLMKGAGPCGVGRVHLGLLTAQKEAIEHLLSELQEDPFEIACLQLPRLKDLLFLSNAKGKLLCFHISQLVDEKEYTSGPAYLGSLFSRLANSLLKLNEPLTDEQAAGIIQKMWRMRYDGLLYNMSGTQVDAILMSLLGSPERNAGVTDEQVEEMMSIALYYGVDSDSEVRKYPGVFWWDFDERMPISLRGSTGDLLAAEVILDKLENLTEDLRLFLINTFRIEEFG